MKGNTMRPLSLLLVVFFAIVGASFSHAEADVQQPTVTLDRAVHFIAGNGSDVQLPPGTYGVEQAGQERLRLVPGASQPPVEIQAAKTSHEESVSTPLALAVLEEGQNDQIHLVLLLPGGQGLDAAGSYSGVRSRAAISALRPAQIQSAVNQFKTTPQQAVPVPPVAAARLPQLQPTPVPVINKGKWIMWSYLQMNHPEIVAQALADVQAGKRPLASVAGLASQAELNEILKTNWASEATRLNAAQAAGAVTTRDVMDAGKAQGTTGVVAGSNASSLAARLSPSVTLNVALPPRDLGSAWSGQRSTTTITITAPADGFVRAELDLNATRQRFRIVEAKAYTGEVNNGQSLVTQTVKGGDYNDIRLSASDPSKHISMAGSVAVNVRAGQHVDITVGFEPDSITGPPVGNYEVMLEVRSNAPTWRRSIPIRARCEGINFGVMAYAEQGHAITLTNQTVDYPIVVTNAAGTPVSGAFSAQSLPPGVSMSPLPISIPAKTTQRYTLRFRVEMDGKPAQDGPTQPIVVALNAAGQRPVNLSMSIYHPQVMWNFGGVGGHIPGIPDHRCCEHDIGTTGANAVDVWIQKAGPQDAGFWWWRLGAYNLKGVDVGGTDFEVRVNFNANPTVQDTIKVHIGPRTQNQYYETGHLNPWINTNFLDAADGGVTFGLYELTQQPDGRMGPELQK